MRNRQKGQKGFSLVELLIVVCIILVIAAIAIPSFLRAKMAANEASAVASLRTINTAEIVYTTTFNIGSSQNLASLGSGGTPCDMNTIPTQTAACLTDDVLAQDPATKNGYTFTYTPAAADSNGVVGGYSLSASPVNIGGTGQQGFFTNDTCIVYADPSGTATASSSPL
jgi:type IV pilus assembly protein PilA